MQIIGLTGGIGSGKTTVANLFAARGAWLVDTDLIAHSLSAPGQAGAIGIGRQFGPDYLLPDGAIDRAKLRSVVFGDAAAKQKLEAIMHPLIRQTALAQLREKPADSPYALLVVPLLFETGAYADVVTRTLVVDCPEPMQIARVQARNGLDEATVRKIMQSQIDRQTRLARADDVIENIGDTAELIAKVEKLHEQYAQST